MSEGKPTSLVRDGGVEAHEEMGDEPVTPTGTQSSGDIDSPPAAAPAIWLSSHSGWAKWSRWSFGAPLRSVYQEGATERRRLVSHLLGPGEEVMSDGPAYRVGGPDGDESDQHSGHLLVATEQLIFVPEDESMMSLRYSELRAVDFVKQKSGWVTVELSTDAGERWAIVALPRTVRVVRRRLKEIHPSVLR